MKKSKSILLIVAGGISILLGLICFARNVGYPETRSIYGGDAYTGIQNAAAKTATNVVLLSQTVKFGFGSLLLVGGLALIAVGIPEGRKVKDTPVPSPRQTDRTEPRPVETAGQNGGNRQDNQA